MENCETKIYQFDSNDPLEFFFTQKTNFYFFFLQPGGDGQALTVFLENSVSAKDVWALSDSWTNEPKWNEGRIEINGDELADDTKYKVRLDFDKKM